jgi:predicted DNA-binding protein with PD1-like motif
MITYCKEGTGRLVVINLERGELLLESIKSELEKLEIRDAVITSAIGSLSKAVLHRVTGFEPTPVDEFITIEKPIELASLQGIVLDGHPHFHMVVSDLEKTYTGHLEAGTTVLYLVEISLLELKNAGLKRTPDELGIAKLRSKT